MPRFKGTFHQSVEGIEFVQVVVEADTMEEAVQKIEAGDYKRYKVIDNDFVRTKNLGKLDVSEDD